MQVRIQPQRQAGVVVPDPGALSQRAIKMRRPGFLGSNRNVFPTPVVGSHRQPLGLLCRERAPQRRMLLGHDSNVVLPWVCYGATKVVSMWPTPSMVLISVSPGLRKRCGVRV